MAGPFNVTKGTGFPYSGGGQVFVLEGEYDSTKQPLAQNEVAQLINIPENTFVQKVFYKIATGQGASQTFELGDESDTDGYAAAVDAQTAGGWVASSFTLADGTPNTVVGYGAGKLYTGADTIDLKALHAAGLTKAVIAVKVVCVRIA